MGIAADTPRESAVLWEQSLPVPVRYLVTIWYLALELDLILLMKTLKKSQL